MNTPSTAFWNARYGADEFIYGTKPNDFIVEHFERIPRGRVLCLGAGEGRNAVFLAQQGYQVVAVDGSVEGTLKTARLAADKNVSVEAVTADLHGFDVGQAQWSGIISVFCHLPSKLRSEMHARVPPGLVAGGVFLLEGYTPAQLTLGTGGPPVAEMLYTKSDLVGELAGLDFVLAHEIEREVEEGSAHHGRSAVVQLVGVKS